MIEKIRPESGLNGVKLYIEDKYGEYRMNGDVERNLRLQHDHEKLTIDVIATFAEVSKEKAKSIYSIAYYYGHYDGIEMIDTYVEVAIQAVKASKVWQI